MESESVSDDKEKLSRIIDNQDGNTMARAIRDALKLLRKQKKSPTELQIASAYFNPQGLELIAEEAKYLPSIRLLLGAEPAPEMQRYKRLPGDRPDPEWTEEQVEKSILNLDQAIREERNHLPFDIETDRAIRTLLDFLTSNKIEARRYTTRFLHAKAFLFLGPEEQLLTGSSNLTRAGLQSNLELNLGIRDPNLLGEIKNWYKQLWENSEPYDLAKIYQELFAEFTPYQIYILVLWQLYGKEIKQESEEINTEIKLSNFQQHGVKRAMRILSKYHGVLIADGVGLGKTYTASAIIREYSKEKKSILVICPAALVESTWKDIQVENKDFFEIISYEKLMNDQLLGGRKRHLKERSIEKYALVVIDEAHNYRHSDNKRSAVLRKFLKHRKDLVLLTATPVNNSIMDLYTLFTYFLRQDAALSDKDITSIREVFQESAMLEANKINPDTLFPIIDALTVKRPRGFIKKFYPNDSIPTEDGGIITMDFPKPIPKKITYQLDEISPTFFDDLKDAIMPEEGDPKITLARYKADNYLKGRKRSLRIQYNRNGQEYKTKIDLDIEDNPIYLFKHIDDNPLGIVVDEVDLVTHKYQGVIIVESSSQNMNEGQLKEGDIIRSINGIKTHEKNELSRVISNVLSIRFENALIGLIRSNLLKRFESSIRAFSLTLGRLINSYEIFLESIDKGKIPLREFFQEYNNTDDELIMSTLLEDETVFDDIEKYNIDKLRTDLGKDIEILSRFKSTVDQIDQHNSSKLAQLKNQLKSIIEKAEKDAIDDEDAKQKRKVMIFSYFEETVHWIKDYLLEILETDPDLQPYKNKMAVVTGGSDEWEGNSRDNVINQFAPITTKAPEGTEDKYDLIICTDVLAEGLNLQQCRNIINYDLPWNPMRLVQRHGRIDRLGSNHKEVYLHSFFPDNRLDDLLGLETRIRNKLAQAAASIGVEDAPIVDGIETETSFSDNIEDIRGIYNENSSIFEEGGTVSAAQTGEIYRAELRNAYKNIKPQELPNRIGSGIKKGLHSGYFFCAEITFKGKDLKEIKRKPLLRFIYKDENSQDTIIKDLAKCLRIIECTKDDDIVLSDKSSSGAYDAWGKTKKDILEWWLKRTDPAYFQPTIPKVNRDVANFIKEYPPGYLDHEKLDKIIGSVEAPWPARDSNALRKIWKIDYSTNKEKSEALCKKIEDIGAEVYILPQPLAFIEPEDIKLICWMAIESEDN
jgi:hypothetical protein